MVHGRKLQGFTILARPQTHDKGRGCDEACDDANRGANAVISVDLEKQEIRGPDGGCITFEIDAFRRHCLLNGLDDIGLTLEKATSIDSFEKKTASSRPWA